MRQFALLAVGQMIKTGLHGNQIRNFGPRYQVKSNFTFVSGSERPLLCLILRFEPMRLASNIALLSISGRRE